MFDAHRMPGESGYTKGSEDSDLAPKPLRIVKRGSPKRSEISDVSSTLSTTSTQRTLVPTRSSSISFESTQIELSPIDFASAASSWTGRCRSLQISKQRHSDPVKPITAATLRSGVSPASIRYETRGTLPHYRRMSDMVDDGAARRRFSDVQANPTSRITRSRALTVGAFNTNNLINPISHEPSLSRPTSIITAKRRGMTAVSNRGQGEDMEDNRGAVLHRDPSLKNRLITRMMSGLSHRSHMSNATSYDPGRSQLVENSLGSHPHVSESMDSSRRTSSSSGRTDTLNNALASFPTPPTSNEASPTAAGSFSRSHLESLPNRALCKAEETAIVGAELRMTAEYDQLGSDNGHSMLVAIDIEGAMNKTGSGQSLWSQHTGLDVAVVIDNSLYTSPNMLMASCEITRSLASILNVVTDRMAVLCTSPINDHRTLGANFTKIWPLSGIKLQKLKTVLDAVVNTKEVPSTSSWKHTIGSATEILCQSMVPETDAEILQDTFGLVIILTANPEGIPSSSLAHDKLRFHLVCPASVPRHNFDAVSCNGWKLRSNSGREPQAGKALKDTDRTSLLNKLRDLIMHARGGKDAGKLTYLSLDIKAGSRCRIESVIGKSEYLTLHPGELRTILVKLKVPGVKTEDHTLPRSATLPALGQYSIEIEDELDRMLRAAPLPAKVLTARLKYKHSSLSANTTCSVFAECSLKKRVESPVDEMQSKKVFAEEPVKVKSLVHERLAYHIATQGSPGQALSAFRNEFGDEGWRSHCPDYTHFILNELKYQARITERLEIDASPKKMILPHTMNWDPLPNDPFGHTSRLALNNENTRPENWFTEDLNDDTPHSPRVQLITVDDLKKATKPVAEMHAELEQARLLWDNLRKRDTVPEDLGDRRAVGSKQEDERIKKLRKMVVRDHNGGDAVTLPKRLGIKAAAMKRITSAGESLGKGLGGV